MSSTLCERCAGLQHSVAWMHADFNMRHKVSPQPSCLLLLKMSLLVRNTDKEVVHVSGLCKILTGYYVTFIKSM